MADDRVCVCDGRSLLRDSESEAGGRLLSKLELLRLLSSAIYPDDRGHPESEARESLPLSEEPSP